MFLRILVAHRLVVSLYGIGDMLIATDSSVVTRQSAPFLSVPTARPADRCRLCDYTHLRARAPNIGREVSEIRSGPAFSLQRKLPLAPTPFKQKAKGLAGMVFSDHYYQKTSVIGRLQLQYSTPCPRFRSLPPAFRDLAHSATSEAAHCSQRNSMSLPTC